MIEYKDGHYRSVGTQYEYDKILQDEISNLTDDEKSYLNKIFDEIDDVGGSASLADVEELEYEKVLISVEEWINSEYYCGTAAKELYPKLREDFIELMSGDYIEAIMTGAWGYGKTYYAALVVLRLVYELSVLRNPQKSLNLATGTTIYFICLSLTKMLTKEVSFDDIRKILYSSEYFMREFKPVRDVFDKIEFPKNISITIKPCHDDSILGLAVLGILWDESNFLKQGKVGPKLQWYARKTGELYDVFKTRLVSRFTNLGKAYGKLLIISSKRTKSDFTEQRIRSGMDDELLFVRDYAVYEVKPGYSAQTFRVLLGVGKVTPRILEDNEAVDLGQFAEEDDAVICNVPIELKGAFKNIANAARNFCGYSLDAIHRFIRVGKAIYDSIDESREHPVKDQIWRFGDKLEIDWNKLCIQKDGKWIPRYNPHLKRIAHVDQSKSECNSAITIGHIPGIVKVERFSIVTGYRTVEAVNSLFVDFILAIHPPDEGDIILGDIQDLLIEFMAHGFIFSDISFDGYQSLMPMQLLAQRGIKIHSISTDKTMGPMESLKSYLYEERIKQYRHELAIKELRQLEHDVTRGKVVKPPNGSKDIADCLASMCFLADMKPVANFVNMGSFGRGGNRQFN